MTKKLNGKNDFCPVYRIKSLDDPFGCEPPENVYALTKAHTNMLELNGFVNMDVSILLGKCQIILFKIFVYFL